MYVVNVFLEKTSQNDNCNCEILYEWTIDDWCLLCNESLDAAYTISYCLSPVWIFIRSNCIETAIDLGSVMERERAREMEVIPYSMANP